MGDMEVAEKNEDVVEITRRRVEEEIFYMLANSLPYVSFP